MGFWKNLQAVLQHPDIVSELETERTTRKQLSDALAATESELGRTEIDAFLLERKVGRMAEQIDACLAAVRGLCSDPPSTEELKHIYNAIAPVHDPHGFSLYFSAKTLTGIDISNYFPYEENRRLFEDAKGPLLLQYLTAARFNAVTWEPVPGTTYEKAILGTVDTSTPEYHEFERAVYSRTLEWQGFETVLTQGKDIQRPDQQKSEHKRGDAR